MFWKSFCSLVLLTLISAPLNGQDVVIYSKKSDNIAKQIQELINEINDKAILKAYQLNSVTPKTEVSTEYNGKTFKADSSMEAKIAELVKATMDSFKEKAGALDRKDVASQVPLLKTKTIEDLTKELNKFKLESLAPLKEALKRLNAENSANENLESKLGEAEAKDLSQAINDTLATLKDLNEDAVIKAKGEPAVEIKKTAEAMTLKQAEEKYPYPNKKDKELEAVKKYPKFKVGDKVSVTFYPTPTRPQKASGTIRSMTKDKIKVNFSTINIDDIKDPIMRDGMRPEVTDANRKNYVDDIFTAIRKARTKFHGEKLQPNADSIIAENEKNGFILTGGKWQPVSEYATTLLNKKLLEWKDEKLTLLELAKLQDGKLIKAVEAEEDGFHTPVQNALNKFKDDIEAEAKQVQEMVVVAEGAEGFTDKDLEKIMEQQKIAAAKKAEEDAKKNQEALKKKQAINKKRELANKVNEEPEEAGSSQFILISVVLLIVGAIAFVFFNPKLRDKLIPSGKKKNMEDVISNLAPPPGNGPLPMPGGPDSPGVAPPPGVPAGMSAPSGGETDKTKIDLDGDVSIVKRDDVEDAPQAAPRKKISLNLGSSAAPLTEDSTSQAGTTQTSIDPGSIGGLTPPGGLKPPGGGLTPPGGGLTPPGGGLTPPGGGLTPPGGGLTPPGGASQAPGSDDSGGEAGTNDKSNLILNPNLDGSGSKLRLKK